MVRRGRGFAGTLQRLATIDRQAARHQNISLTALTQSMAACIQQQTSGNGNSSQQWQPGESQPSRPAAAAFAEN